MTQTPQLGDAPRRADRNSRQPEMIDAAVLEALKQMFANEPAVSLAWLFGSRTTGAVQPSSDWDFAVWFAPVPDVEERLILKEEVRCMLASLLRISSDSIDVVELNGASLSILATVADEGVLLKGDGNPALFRFYRRVWALTEDFYWRLSHENRTLSGRN